METPRTPDAKPKVTSPLESEDAAIVARLGDARLRVREQIAKVIVGQETVIDHMLVGLLCRGHILLLGVPGLGKTLMARTLARTLDLEFRRIQFTPDLMPSDITGMDIIEEDAGDRPAQAGIPSRADLHQLLARRRDQPHAPQDPGRLVAGDAGARGLDRQAHLSAQSAVLRGRHPEPDRDGRHLSVARGPARPVHVQSQGQVSDDQRGDADRQGDDRHPHGRGSPGA